MSGLTRGRVRPSFPAYLDPDLSEDDLPRVEGWRGAFGQTGSAASHLSERLVLPGLGDCGLPGWGRIRALERRSTLTAPRAASRSAWQLPGWFSPARGSPLTYHESAERWFEDGERVLLKSVGRGRNSCRTASAASRLPNGSRRSSAGQERRSANAACASGVFPDGRRRTGARTGPPACPGRSKTR